MTQQNDTPDDTTPAAAPSTPDQPVLPTLIAAAIGEANAANAAKAAAPAAPRPFYRSVQAFPSGHVYRVAGAYPEYEVLDGESPRPATPDERDAIKREELAEAYLRTEVWCCDSAFVDALMKAATGGEIADADLRDAFQWDEVVNLYADPEDWSRQECLDWLQENGHDLPAGVDPTKYDAATYAAIRECVRENDTGQQVYEWWRVSGWLAAKLKAVGEPVLCNSYGQWWGRTVTGQSVVMDGTLQKIASDVISEEH